MNYILSIRFINATEDLHIKKAFPFSTSCALFLVAQHLVAAILERSFFSRTMDSPLARIARGRDETPSPMASAAAAAVSGAADTGAAIGQGAGAGDSGTNGSERKRARTPVSRSRPQEEVSDELKTVKERVKTLEKKMNEENAESLKIKEEVKTSYPFATETRHKLAQHLFYFKEIDRALTQQQNEVSKNEAVNKEYHAKLDQVMGAFENLKNAVDAKVTDEVNQLSNVIKADGDTLLKELQKVQKETFQDSQEFKLTMTKIMAEVRGLITAAGPAETMNADKLHQELQHGIQQLQMSTLNLVNENFKETRQMVETAIEIQDAEINGLRSEIKNVSNQVKAAGGTCPCTSGRCPCKCNSDPLKDP